MPFIPRQVKPPTRIAITCKLPQHVATVLKCYAEFLDSSQEYVVTETLQLAFRRDREFQTWLATTHPDLTSALDSSSAGREQAAPSRAAIQANDAPRTRATAMAAPAASSHSTDSDSRQS